VLESEKHPSTYWLPERCPFCRTPLVKEGAHHFCKNESCPERRRRALDYFCAKEQMDIETLGEKTIALLYAKGWVRTIPDLYAFDYGKLAGQEGFKEKKIARIRASIEKSKSRPFVRVLAALGFEGLAAAVANDLIAHGFADIDRIIAVAARGDWETFAAIDGIGEATARQLVGHFSKPDNLDNRPPAARRPEILAAEPLAAPARRFLRQPGLVITGSFEKFQPALAGGRGDRESAAARSRFNVGARTLPPAGRRPSRLKRAKAEKLGVSIISESEFRLLAAA
jgi:DNA ligase (NAD+)